MRVFDRFRRQPPPPYVLADPGLPTSSEIAQSLVTPPWPSRPAPSSRAPTPGSQRPSDRPNRKPSGLSRLPLGVLHRICELTLLVPRGWDEDADAARARWALYSLRGVDRRFFIVVTSILRARVLPAYSGRVTESSDPIGAGSEDAVGGSVFAHRTREGAVLDRFLALRVGFEMRRAESSLTEDGGEEDQLFAFLQPAARIEDLLVTLPPHLITEGEVHGAVGEGFPLPHGHVAVSLSSRWVQVFLLYSPHGRRSTGRALVVEIRRQETAEKTVERLGVVLEAIRMGSVPWGSTRVE